MDFLSRLAQGIGCVLTLGIIPPPPPIWEEDGDISDPDSDSCCRQQSSGIEDE
jgi:hypothetical protein